MDFRVEVAIDALHSLLKMDVVEVDGLLEITGLDFVIFEIQQVAFFVLLENGPVNPAVAMVIGELRVL